jgi:hypothetical protein
MFWSLNEGCMSIIKLSKRARRDFEAYDMERIINNEPDQLLLVWKKEVIARRYQGTTAWTVEMLGYEVSGGLPPDYSDLIITEPALGTFRPRNPFRIRGDILT